MVLRVFDWNVPEFEFQWSFYWYTHKKVCTYPLKTEDSLETKITRTPESGDLDRRCSLRFIWESWCWYLAQHVSSPTCSMSIVSLVSSCWRGETNGASWDNNIRQRPWRRLMRLNRHYSTGLRPRQLIFLSFCCEQVQFRVFYILTVESNETEFLIRGQILPNSTEDPDYRAITCIRLVRSRERHSLHKSKVHTYCAPRRWLSYFFL